MTKVTPEQFSRIVKNKMRSVVEQGRQIVQDNADYGAELVRDTVETSGTMKSGKRGRIDTGEMLQAVDSYFVATPDGGEGHYGWVAGSGPFYTKYQELGTQYIEPMQAIPEAREQVDIDFKNDIDRMMKRTWG